MAGSLLQQRVEAEKQEIENMKLQLKMREQAGVLGARNLDANDASLSPLSPGLLATHYQIGGNGRGVASTTSNSSLPSATQAYPYQQQKQTLLSQSPPKFGGPGTLIEQGEVRAAQLQRSKSAGTGLLRPSHGANTSYVSSNNTKSRTRSRSRGPAEDRVAYGRPVSPTSPRSPEFAPPIPQGPLLQFADPDAMIQPGLLLNRARSAKQTSYNSSASQRPSTGTRRPAGGASSSNLVGQIQNHSSHNQGSSTQGARGRVKPLIDLGNTSTGSDLIGPGLLTNASNNSSTHSNNPSSGSHSQSSRSPRRPKPLLDF
ncbi:hypothetical protein FBU30_003423 [Linnemannia zychae]|nr:hypothetical protein FBU30_003423 [Linnemannia zychae]